MKKRLLIMLIMVLLLTGCSNNSNADTYKEQAQNLVNSNISEEFSYKSSEIVDKNVEHYRYNFTSNERELSMSVESYIQDGKRIFVSDYLQSIQGHYEAQILAHLRDNVPSFDEPNQTITINNLEELDYVIEQLYYCECLYAEENKYQDQYFTLNNPILNLTLLDADGNEKAKFEFCGYFTEDEIADNLYEMFMSEVE